MKDNELIEQMVDLIEDYALQVDDRGHDASNPWLTAGILAELCKVHYSLKDHEIGILVNEITAKAKTHCHAQALRGVLSEIVVKHLKK